MGHGVHRTATVDPVGVYVPGGHSVEMTAEKPVPTIGTSLVTCSLITPVDPTSVGGREGLDWHSRFWSKRIQQLVMDQVRLLLAWIAL